MSRQFDTSGGADSITCSPGNAPPDQGPITLGVLAKSFSVAGFTMWMARGTKTGTAIWGMLTSNNSGPKLFAENDFGNGVAGLSTSWRWYVMTKASGSALPRIHVWDLSGAWTHTDNSANVADGTGPIDTIIIGSAGGGANGWRGSIAVAAAFATAMNDAAVEAAFTLLAADTLAASPGWMVRLNQASTATAVTDDTGGGGDQSAISGTSVDADDPPGYDYSLTPPVVEGASDFTETFSITSAGSGTKPGASDFTETFSITSAGVTQPGGQSDTAVAFGITSAGAVTHAGGAALSLAFGINSAPEQSAPAPVVGNGWSSLLSIYQQNAEDTHLFLTTPIVECPIHREPLQPGRTPGTVHCPFGGELYDLYGNPALIG